MSLRVELQVDRVSNSGDGVAQHQGRAVFLSGTLPGERVAAEIAESGKVLRGENIEILSPSPARRSPSCSLAARCGGCDWMHIEEATQIELKQELVLSSIEHLGGLSRDSFELLPLVKSTAALGYRRRASLHPVGASLGFHGRGSHARVQVESCPALTAPLSDFPGRLAARLGANSLKELEEVRLLECDGRVAVSLHFRAQIRPRHRDVMMLALRDGMIDGAILQPGEGKGQAEVLGKPVLEDDGVLHRPDGFAQANAEVNRRLVQQAVELLEPRPADRLLELYCGNGNFTYRLAAAAAHVTAVESAALSVALAQQGALDRGLNNVRFVQGDSEKTAAGLVRENARFERLLVDPPRSGASGVGAWAAQLLVDRVAYVACEPTSLARDAKGLVAQGYRPLALQLFDLFPQTHHVEALMVFSR